MSERDGDLKEKLFLNISVLVLRQRKRSWTDNKNGHPLKGQVVLLCENTHPYGAAPTQDALSGAGVKVPDHLERELEV